MTQRLWPFGEPITGEHHLPPPSAPPIASRHVLITCLRRAWALLRLWRLDAQIEDAEYRYWQMERQVNRVDEQDPPPFINPYALPAERLQAEVEALKQEQAQLEKEIRG